MLVLFMGPTASGKSSLLTQCCKKIDVCEPVIRLTTRARRPGERDGKDYVFVSVKEFKQLKKGMVEFEEYSGDRFYGTRMKDLFPSTGKAKCLTITPSGLLNICMKNASCNILVVYCECSLATQVQRYSSRTGSFTVEDKMEMSDRLARDEGMFKGVETLFKAAEKLHQGNFGVLRLDTDQFNLEECMDIIKPNIENLLDA